MTDVSGSSGEIGIKGMVITAPKEHPRIRINKWRVREGYPVSSSQIILLYEVLNEKEEEANKTIHKLKACRVGVVKKRLFKDGEIVEQGAAILELSECVHTTVIKDMCANCGADLRQNENGNISQASVPMVHAIPDLKVTQQLAQKLGQDDTRRLLQDRKLVLLVDLDQTVIHTTNDNVPNNIKGIYHFQLYGPLSPWYHTRLRPGTSEFLKSMSKYYELHICTFGARNYAHMIAQLLDPKGEFFSHRILSRDECFNLISKTDNLKALFPNGDSMVCIIDDREDVWNLASNLIQVKPYHFFQHTGDINAPPGLSKNELDGEGMDFKDMDYLPDKENSKPDEAEKKSETDVENKEENDGTKESEFGSTEKAAESQTEQPSSSKSEEISSKIETSETEDKSPITDTTPTTEDKSPITDTIPTTEDKSPITDTTPTTEDKSPITDTTPTTEVANPDNPSPATENAEVEVDVKPPGTDGKEKPAEPPKEEDEKIEDDARPNTSSTCISPKIKICTDSQKLIEIEDSDDYLLYLEVILKSIHKRFYSIYDKTREIPDLKIIVPKIRSEVLLGQNLVFSGLVPTNMKLEQSRAYFIAKSLGANVSQNIGSATTHLVAVTSGTFKVNAAKKNSQIKVVNANWLWSCAERWEHVEEKLYPLDRKTKGKQRQPPAHCHSPEHVVNYSDKSEISISSSTQQQNASEPEKFQDTINPLLSFSCAEIADMNKEYDQFFDSDTSSEDEHINIENPPVDKSLRKRKREEKGEERTREFFTRSSSIMISTAGVDDADKSSCEEENDNDNENEEEEDDDETPSAKFRRGAELPSDLEIDSEDSNDSNNNPDTEDDGDWNMLGAALEREFLGLEED